MLDKLAYMMGGRAAEEMVFHDPTTGAGNDIEKATSLARAMVTQYGMTERLGAIKLGEAKGEPFLGRDMGHQRDYSEEVAAIVDEETKKLLETAHQEALDILDENRDVLDSLVLALMEKETLDKAAGRRGLRAAASPPGASRVDRLARPQPLGHPAGARSPRRSGRLPPTGAIADDAGGRGRAHAARSRWRRPRRPRTPAPSPAQPRVRARRDPHVRPARWA